MSDTVFAAVVASCIAGGVSVLVGLFTAFGSESYKRHRDAQALAGGLIGELTAHGSAYSELFRVWRPVQQAAERGMQLAPIKMPRPTSPVYEANVGALDALGPAIAEDVAYVYSNIEAFRSMMSFLGESNMPAARQAAVIASALQCIERAEQRGTP